MLVFVAVLYVLCVFVVKSPLFVSVLHRTRMAPARMSTTLCLKGVRYSLNVGHQCEVFSPPHASLISVGRFPHMTKTISMSLNVIIFIVRFLPAL